MGGDGQSVTAATQYDISVAQAASAYAQSSKSLQDYSVAGPISKDQQDKAVIQIKKMTTMSKSTSSKKATGRKVFIMRHGERMDRLFPEWLHVAITDEVRTKKIYFVCLGKIFSLRLFSGKIHSL